MSLHNEVLQHLTQDENNAMTSGDLFKLCKGAEESSDISTALSQLFKMERIKRKVSNNGGASRYIYWQEQASAEAAVNEIKVNSPTAAASAMMMAMAQPINDVIKAFNKEGDLAPSDVNAPPTINLKAKITLPAMPNTLVVTGLKPATLDDAYASNGNFTIDVSTLDALAIEQVIQSWGAEFRQHVATRKLGAI